MHLQTYQIRPFILYGSDGEVMQPTPTEWLRKALLLLVNRSKARLAKAGISHEVFHNHDAETGNTIARYPLVLYQQRGGQLYVTGINQGAEALDVLISQYERPVEIDRNSLLGFIPMKAVDADIRTTPGLQAYTLTEWLPFNSQNHKVYKSITTLVEKVSFLEQLITVNLTKDFGRFFSLDLELAEVSLLKVSDFGHSCRQLTVNGRKKDFQPFTVRFETNVQLPDFINLGNGKVYGYGLVTNV